MEQLGQQEGSHVVHRDGRLEPVLGDAPHGVRGRRVVDQEVEPLMALEYLSGHRPDLALGGQVADQQLNLADRRALPDLRSGRFASPAIAANQQHHRACPGEPERGLLPEPRTGPRHETRLPAERGPACSELSTLHMMYV